MRSKRKNQNDSLTNLKTAHIGASDQNENV